jgi:hypothetical protein
MAFIVDIRPMGKLTGEEFRWNETSTALGRPGAGPEPVVVG